MGRPLTEEVLVASSWMTSQCSASRPSLIRTTSSTIQFAWPLPEKRPCNIDEIPVGHDPGVLIPQRRRCVSYQVEQAFAAGRNVGAVLDVVG